MSQTLAEYADISMSPEARQALAYMHQLTEQLRIRQGDVLRYQRYYDGFQPLKYATEEYRKFFGKQYDGFSDNWCSVVVDTLAEKLTVAGFKLPETATIGDDHDGDMSVDREFARVWAMNECDQQSSQAIVEALIAKRSFALVWGNNDDPDTPEISFESPDECIIGYDPGARRKRKGALKLWTDGEYNYATLYTATHIWKWQQKVSPNTQLWTPDWNKQAVWVPRFSPGDDMWPVPNPAGVVPMVELANRPRLRNDPISEIAGVAAMQDAINSQWAYLFTSSDFAALPQRVILGAELPKLPVLDNNGQPVKGAFRPVDPNIWMEAAAKKRVLSFQGDDAKIAQWDAADLSAFTNVIEFAIGNIAAQTRTPAHYFMTGKISNISADGLEALGQAHVAKARERASYFGAAIRELAVVQYLMRGDAKRAAAARLGQVVWNDFETRSMAATADYALKLSQSGFSFKYVASQVISDPRELADEIARHEVEQAQMAAMREFGPKQELTPPEDLASEDDGDVQAAA